MQMLVQIGLLCMEKILKLRILTVFRVEHVPTEIKKFIGHKNIKTYLEYKQTIQ